MDPRGRYYYTTTRNDNSIETYAIDQDKGALSLVERIPTTGVLPWGCDLDQTGRFFFVTNLTSNSVSLFKVDPVSGKLSQAGPDVSSPMPVTAITVPV
jgi:6-phosphogluconolactonase